ncbi:MAG: AAA family ATPase [Rhizomicrobium sp.]
MLISRIKIANFRGIHVADIHLPKHGVLIGDNNTGKTTLLEAIDLALGPDRLNRRPPIDEHDFYEGKYVAPVVGVPEGEPHGGGGDISAPPQQPAPKIEIEVTVCELNEEQRARFGDYMEFWDTLSGALYIDAIPEGVDAASITEALRVTFVGNYNSDEDDFEGNTYFTRSLTEDTSPRPFRKLDKQICGFLYLRSLRTGSRALSLEHGSLLDIILRLKEVRPQMWEATLNRLAAFNVASDPKLGISGVLESINTALNKYVPKEWGVEPHLKVSNLTREHLRTVITAFIATGKGTHSAPYYRQGTGTINMLVLAMLSQIAQDKQNVIFAMEEPETAIPPYAQKRIVHEIRNLSSQALFTSHSPYVLEEFSADETVVLKRNEHGDLKKSPIALPDSVKPKRYRQEFRTRFCEGLLARRVLVAEGATEAVAVPAVARRLSELNPNTYRSLEALGICILDAGGGTNIADIAKFYRDLGKQVFALSDKQTNEEKVAIEAHVDALYMHDEKGFENLVLKNTSHAALARFCQTVEWPQHILADYPDPRQDAAVALSVYFKAKKADGAMADFLVQCAEAEIPQWLRDLCVSLRTTCEPPPPLEPIDEQAPGTAE